MTTHEPKKPCVLLMYITRVSGHRQATLAVQQTLKSLYPDIKAPSVNGFGYTYPILEKIIHNTYMGVIKSTPQVWDYLYDNPKVFKRSASLQKFLHRTSHDKIARLLKRHKPDAVVCTQAFPCGMVADYKKVHNLTDLKLIGVLTDFAPHSYWINDGIDYYVVPSEDSKERFVAKGVDPKKIKVFGIPLRPEFSEKLNKKELYAKFELNEHVPTILIMGGGQGLGPIKKIVKSLIKLRRPLQVIVLAGTNKKVVEKIQKLANKTNKKILVYEFANNVHELMEISTMIITKTGGMTTAESLAKGLPMVIVNPIPGQEMRNTDFLLQHGMAIRVEDADETGDEVELLLRSPEHLTAMRESAMKYSRPNASYDIARLILEDFSIPEPRVLPLHSQAYV
jgi:processive 1,2-diacylglycerol beta-glucosyltransferase